MTTTHSPRSAAGRTVVALGVVSGLVVVCGSGCRPSAEPELAPSGECIRAPLPERCLAICRSGMPELPPDLPQEFMGLANLTAALRFRDGWLAGTDRSGLRWAPPSGPEQSLPADHVTFLEQALGRTLVLSSLERLGKSTCHFREPAE